MYLDVDERAEGKSITIGCRYCPGYSGFDVSRKEFQHERINNGRPRGELIQELQVRNEEANSRTFYPPSQHNVHIGAHSGKSRSASEPGLRHVGSDCQSGNQDTRVRASSAPAEPLTLRQEWDEQLRQREVQEKERKMQDEVNQKAVMKAQHELDSVLRAQEQFRMKYGGSY
jgi:hypothetical protein